MITKIESIYPRLPIWAQQTALQLQAIRVWLARRRATSQPFLDELKQHENLDAPALAFLRTRRLSSHLKSASQSPFWARRFADFGVNPASKDPFAEISKLPILSKDEVKDAGSLIFNPLYDSKKLRYGSTSGTTGGGLLLRETPEAENERWGVWWRYRSRFGISPSTRCAYFGARIIVPIQQARPPYWRSNLVANQVMFSSFHLGPDTFHKYVEKMDSFEAPWIHGFPTTLALLAGYMLDEGVRLRHKIKIVTIGAENLQQAQRVKIEAAFDAKVVQHYGLAESVANISECVCGRLHVDEDFSHVEFVPHPAVPGLSQIIGTNWSNPAMPLIRYNTGDLATLDISKDPCACGLTWRSVSSIDGRLDDLVTLRSGARVGRLAAIFKDFIEIKEAQILQVSIGKFVLRVVRGSGYQAALVEQRLLDSARSRLGSDSEISIDYVAQLPRTAAGKVRLVVRE